MNRPVYDMAIIGGGPGGYTAALYAARAGLKTVVLEKLSPGGQMALTSTIDNYPGFPQGVDGWELSQAMAEGAERFGAESELVEVFSANLKADPKQIDASFRISLSRETTQEELDTLYTVIRDEILPRAR